MAVLAGCASENVAPPATTIRDSANVRIATTEGAERLPALDWTVDRGIEIGATPEEATRPLFQITGATRLSDGRIVVGSAGNHQLRFYSAEGEPLATAGWMGTGPGEFQALMWIGSIRGDTVLAWDAAAARLSVFDANGRFVRSVTPAATLGLFPRALGALTDGRVILATGAGVAFPQPGKARRDTLDYVLLHPDATLHRLGRFPGAETIALRDPSGGMLIRPLPFGLATVAAAHGSQVFISTAREYEIRAYDPARGLTSVIRTDRGALPVTKQDIEDYRRLLVTLGGPGDSEASRKQERLLEQAPYPERMPAVTALLTDEEGKLWLQESQKPGDPNGSPWTVFAPQGQPLGTMRLPKDLQVHAIGRDWILGVQLDEEHVEHLKLFRLTR